MAGDEHQLVGRGPGEIDLQIVRRGGGLVVFVRSRHREVERPARKLKIVGVAAECGDVGLRSEHQPHVRVALVLVQKVLASLVQGDHLASELAGFGPGACLLARLFQGGQCSFARVIGRRIVQAGGCLGYGVGHVLLADQHVRELGRATLLGMPIRRGEPKVHQALVLG